MGGRVGVVGVRWEELLSFPGHRDGLSAPEGSQLLSSRAFSGFPVVLNQCEGAEGEEPW